MLLASHSCPSILKSRGFENAKKKSSLSLNLKLDLTGLNRTEMGFAILSNLAPSPPVRVPETPQSADVKAKEHLAMGLCYLFLAKYESSTIQNTKQHADEFCGKLISFMTQRELPGYVKELCKHKLTGLLKNCMGYMTLENIKLAHQLLDLGKTN